MKPRITKKRPPSTVGRFFLRGLITLAPVILTVVVFGLLFQVVDRYVTGPINSSIYWTLERNGLGWKALRGMGIEPYSKEYLDPTLLSVDLQDVARGSEGGYSDPRFLEALRGERTRKESFFRDFDDLAIHSDRLRADVRNLVHPLVGVGVSLLVVLWLGWVVGGFLGRRLVQRLDRALHFIPIVRSVYPYSKQLVEFFFAEKRLDFETVVAIPYPSRHVYAIGFVTNNSLRTLREETGKRLLSVFIPSSPMPMTGYTVFVEAQDAIPLPMSIDEALRITMTGGVIVPPDESVEDAFLEELAGATPSAVPPPAETQEAEA